MNRNTKTETDTLQTEINAGWFRGFTMDCFVPRVVRHAHAVREVLAQMQLVLGRFTVRSRLDGRVFGR